MANIDYDDLYPDHDEIPELYNEKLICMGLYCIFLYAYYAIMWATMRWRWITVLLWLSMLTKHILYPNQIWQYYVKIGLCRQVSVLISTETTYDNYIYYRCLEHDYPEYWLRLGKVEERPLRFLH